MNIVGEDENETDDEEYDDIDALLGELYKDPDMSGNQVKKEEKQPSRVEACCDKFLLILAWTIANLGVISSAFFVILYSMQWGATKANAWLVSFILSFVQNAFFADPIKVSTLQCSI